MAYIVLSIIGVIAVLLVKSGWGQKKQVLFILFGLLIGLAMYIIIDLGLEPTVIKKGPSHILQQIPWVEIGLYFVMLAGMAAKYFFDAIGEGNKIRFQKWQFVKPLLISPIVFGLIYSKMGEQSSAVLLFVFSFQNGFFWQSVLKKLR